MSKKHDIRFQVSEEIFRRIKEQARRYDENVAPFCRRIVIDRTFALEVQETNQSLSSIVPLLKQIQGNVGFEKIAGDLEAEGLKSISPDFLKMMETFSGDSEEGKKD